jgi:glutamate synthase (ferredoxin)
MTGGRVVVLGVTGRNFAAGMSGGIAYIYDENGQFGHKCNQEMVSLQTLSDQGEIEEVRAMIQRHVDATCSPLARRLLSTWSAALPKFVRVIPKDYERMLEAFKEVQASGLSGEEAVMAAFELNKNDRTRVSGN